ncbi:MAG: ferritin-like domain-containing protein [Alphaproteobacteria bacterium]|nr:MAG: ferritin-like domain-containing protein [Alphaproteobacteria bacterium]
MSKHWTLDDIAWDSFDPSKVDPDLLATIKTAAMVEANASDYVTYLLNVFDGDDAFCAVVHQWGEEEKQHGAALGRWAQLADPEFSFDASLRRVQEDGFQLPLDKTESVRGSRQGELLARCLVESSTTSFYSAIKDAAEEPVLRQIAELIASDEVNHYRLFHRHLMRYQETHKKISLLERVKVVVGRINESDDDEFAFAYFATNLANKDGAVYDRAFCAKAYERNALGLYQRSHLEMGARMILRAFGFKSQGLVSKTILPVLWFAFQRRRNKLVA